MVNCRKCCMSEHISGSCRLLAAQLKTNQAKVSNGPTRTLREGPDRGQPTLHSTVSGPEPPHSVFPFLRDAVLHSLYRRGKLTSPSTPYCNQNRRRTSVHMASPMVDGRVEPHRKATYTLDISDQIRNEDTTERGFSGVKCMQISILSSSFFVTANRHK